MLTQRGGRVKCICLNCGEEFGVYLSVILQGGGKFHNKQCKDEFLKGENNPFFGKRHTEETKEFNRKSNSGENNPNFGKPRSQVIKDKIGETKKKTHPYRGKHLPKEWKDNMSKSHKGVSNTFLLGKPQPIETKMKKTESMIGGFWYGNVRYYQDIPLYCEKFTAVLRERDRVFWKHRCVKCGKPQSEHLNKNGKPRKLSVHHVHYDKQTCRNGSPRDLVPQCCGCNVEVNTNRKYLEKFFTDIIYALNPNGKCFLTLDRKSVV
jgi:hypothetical protein